jgi:hypothetical protein
MGNVSVRQRDAAREFERQQKEAAVAKATAQLQQTAGALIAKTNEVVKRFWSKPATEIVSIQYDALGEGTDEGIELPTGDGSLDRVKVIETFKQFITYMESRGWTLSRDGRTRLLTYVGYQHHARKADPHNIQSYINGFDRLLDLDAFGDEVGWSADLVKHEPKPAPEALAPEEEASETLEEALAKTNGTTREGARKLRDLVEQTGVDVTFAPIFQQWLDSMYEHWGFVSTPEQRVAAQRYFERHNLSFTHGPHYDQCRRALGKSGIFPLMLTDDEILAERIEQTTLTNNYAGRQDYVRERSKLQGGL